jgi:hypothetical protein
MSHTDITANVQDTALFLEGMWNKTSASGPDRRASLDDLVRLAELVHELALNMQQTERMKRTDDAAA